MPPRRRLRGSLAAVACIGFALHALAGRAGAHSDLVESWIALGATVVKENTEPRLWLRFTGALNPHGSSVELVPEKGDARSLKLVFGPLPGEIAFNLPRLESGRYDLHYRVLATDGHTTEGKLPLRVVASD